LAHHLQGTTENLYLLYRFSEIYRKKTKVIFTNFPLKTRNHHGKEDTNIKPFRNHGFGAPFLRENVNNQTAFN